MSLHVVINTIPHKDQHYETVGDYWQRGGVVTINVSELGDWKKELLIAIHELVEYGLIKDRNIPIEKIDAFDIEYENNRQEGDTTSEPGDDENAPYYKEHQFATQVELMMAKELKIDWADYEEAANSL